MKSQESYLHVNDTKKL